MDEATEETITGEQIWEALQADSEFAARVTSKGARAWARRMVSQMPERLGDVFDLRLTPEHLVRLKREAAVEIFTWKRIMRAEAQMFRDLLLGKSLGYATAYAALFLTSAPDLLHSGERVLPSVMRYETDGSGTPPEPASVDLAETGLNEAARSAYRAGTLTVGRLLLLNPVAFFRGPNPPNKKEETDQPTH